VPIAALATLAVLTLSCASPSPRAAARKAPASAASSAPRLRLPVGDVYSARAKRRMASYLRMRLLELREQGLRRAIDVVERRLPLDALLRVP
jgi:hypothetical protein